MDNNSSHIKCYHCGSNNNELYAKANDIEYFTNNKDYLYYLCNDCEVLFIHPQPLNELVKIYPPNYYSFNDDPKSFSFKIKNKLDQLFFKRHLRSVTKNEINVLDIGGGTGTVCDNIKSIDKCINKIQIVDINSAAEQIAIQKGHTYFRGRMEDFETDQQFDLILMLNLIEHVSSPSAVLKKATQLLSTGGIIIIQTPNYKSLDARIFRHKSWGGYHCPRHWIIFNKKSFLNMSESCGLNPQAFTYTQGAAFWTVSILNKLQQWKWIKASAEKPVVYHPLFGIISMLTAVFDFIRKPFAPLSQMLIVLKHGGKTDS